MYVYKLNTSGVRHIYSVFEVRFPDNTFSPVYRRNETILNLIVHITYKIEFDQSKNKPQDEIFSYLKESLYTIYSYSL